MFLVKNSHLTINVDIAQLGPIYIVLLILKLIAKLVWRIQFAMVVISWHQHLVIGDHLMFQITLFYVLMSMPVLEETKITHVEFAKQGTGASYVLIVKRTFLNQVNSSVLNALKKTKILYRLYSL